MLKRRVGRVHREVARCEGLEGREREREGRAKGRCGDGGGGREVRPRGRASVKGRVMGER